MAITLPQSNGSSQTRPRNGHSSKPHEKASASSVIDTRHLLSLGHGAASSGSQLTTVESSSASQSMRLWMPPPQLTPVGQAFATGIPIYAHVLSASHPWDPTAQHTGERALVDKLLCPLTPSQAGTIRATGLNYTDHAKELGMPIPSMPALFFKPATCLAGPGEVIPIPKCAQSDEMDYEVELAIIIGRTCRDVSAEDAMAHVLGWTCANDLTARKLQSKSTQWGYSKGFDKFCPLGPCIVSTAALPDPCEVTLQTRVNGQLVQSGSARNMIWHVSKIVSFLCTGTTLAPGTVIITGTPSGIGASHGMWLRHGAEVRCCISHGIGSIINTISYC